MATIHRKSLCNLSAGSIPQSMAGGRATTTYTLQAVPTIRIRPKVLVQWRCCAKSWVSTSTLAQY